MINKYLICLLLTSWFENEFNLSGNIYEVKYIVSERKLYKNTSILVFAKVIDQDTLFIDTFFNNFTVTNYSYSHTNNHIYLYSENLLEIDPSANAGFLLTLSEYQIKNDSLILNSYESEYYLRKYDNRSVGYIKDNKFIVSCDGEKVNFVEPLDHIKLNRILTLLDSCKISPR